MGLSFWQILIVVLLIVLLFGRNKISDLMGDTARGIKSFRKGLSDDDDDKDDDDSLKNVTHQAGETPGETPEKDEQKVES